MKRTGTDETWMVELINLEWSILEPLYGTTDLLIQIFEFERSVES